MLPKSTRSTPIRSRIIPAFGLCWFALLSHAQGEYGSLRLTYFMDQLRFEVPGQSRYWMMSKTQTDSKAFALYSPEDGGFFTYWSEGSGNMILSKGNIGIGTSNPQADLHIASQEGDGVVIGRPNDPMGLNGGAYDIKFYGYRDVIGNVFSAKISAERTNSGYNWLHQGTDLTFHTTQFLTASNSDNSIERMRITGAGNVGIGTDQPDSKLTVAGNIHSREVKVTATAGGADFVFDESYDLKTLQETDEFIKQHRHLPEIPSASQMEQEGIELARMNIKLLQKIEELTLYAIAQEKRIQELEAGKIEDPYVKHLEAKIEELSQRLLSQEQRLGELAQNKQ